LELPFWPRGTLKEALSAYLAQLDHIAEDTLEDYTTRSNWLLEVFGEHMSLADITIDRMQEVLRAEGPRGRGLMNVTIKKRFTFLIAAMKYAAARKVCQRGDVPDMPRMTDDGQRGQRVLPLSEYRELRLALPERFRQFADLSYWTGFHALDVQIMTRGMLNPDYVWTDADGKEIRRGRYLRKNHKNKHCEPAWLPMEPEFREVAIEMLREPGSPDAPLLGHVWSLSKAFTAACDRAGIARVKPSQDLRRSFASMLASRGYSMEYIRQAQGHEGAAQFDDAGTFRGAAKPTMDTRHYLRLTDDLIANELKNAVAAACRPGPQPIGPRLVEVTPSMVASEVKALNQAIRVLTSEGVSVPQLTGPRLLQAESSVERQG
jgi:integrase